MHRFPCYVRVVKLDEIYIDRKKMARFMRRAAVWGLQDAATSVHTMFTRERSLDDMAWQAAAVGFSVWEFHALWKDKPELAKSKAFIGTIALQPDFLVIKEAMLWLSIFGGLDAQRMLYHYLTADNVEVAVEVDTEKVLTSDAGMWGYVHREIGAAIRAGRTWGKLGFKQEYYGNQNWRNAFGAIPIDWRLEEDSVVIWFVNRYRWHPTELRNSQAVHEAMERGKRSGAMEFDFYGTDYVVPKSAFE